MSRRFLFTISVCVYSICSLKIEKGFRSLRVEKTNRNGPIACPSNFLAPSIANAILSDSSRMFTTGEVVYNCVRGFVSSLSKPGDVSPRLLTGTCDSSGVLQFNGATCVSGSCSLSEFMTMRHVKITALPSTVRIDSSVSLECETGYTVDGLSSGPSVRHLTCDENAMFMPSTYLDDCLPVSCGNLIIPANSMVLTTPSPVNVYFGNIIEFKCLLGYYFKPALVPAMGTSPHFSQRCVQDGTMMGLEDPTNLVLGACALLKCPSPPTFDGADMIGKSTDTIDLFEKIHFVCKLGNHLSNSTQTVLSSTGKLLVPTQTSFDIACIFDQTANAGVYDTDPQIARCESSPCPLPAVLSANAVLVRQTALKDRYYTGDKIEYTCPFSDQFFETECTPDQQWTVIDESKCTAPAQCDSLANIDPAIIKSANPTGWNMAQKLNVGERLIAVCDPGFESKIDGLSEITIECLLNGNYGTNSACIRKCGPLPKFPAHTSHTPEYTPGGTLSSDTKLVFTCDFGYSLDGKFVTTSNTVQTTECLSTTGLISETPSDCIPVVCGLPQTVTNAHWLGVSATKQYVAGETVNYSCDENYGISSTGSLFVGQFDINCSDQGWDVITNRCVPITCSTVNIEIAHGAIVDNTYASSVLSPKQTLNVQCDQGYSGIGFQTSDVLVLTCGSDGGFLPTNYATDMCSQITCPNLPETLLAGTKTIAATALRFGDPPVVYQCTPQWNLPPITVTCNGDRTYDVIGEECIEPKCSNSILPASLQNSVLLDHSSNNSIIGTIQSVGCQPGFMATDRALQYTVTCIGPGTWTPINPTHVTGCSLNSDTITSVSVR